MLCCSLCFITNDKPGSKAFFKVPKEAQRRKQWGEICRIDFKKKTAWICIDHFLPSHLIKSGKKTALTNNAVPFIPKYQGNQAQTKGTPKVFNSKKSIGDDAAKNQKNRSSENAKQKCTKIVLDSNNKVNSPQTHKNILMQVPIRKSRFCTGSTQTNTRICGSVQASEFADEFRFNCFYCCEIYPLEKWKDFINHLKTNHFQKEKAFEISEYVSEDHDYTPINLHSSSLTSPSFEAVSVKVELEEGPTCTEIESVLLNPTFYYTTDDKETDSNNMDIFNYMIECGSSLIMMNSEEFTYNPLESLGKNPTLYYAQDDNADVLNKFTKTSNSPITIPSSGIINKSVSSKKALPQHFKNLSNKSETNLNAMKTRNKLRQVPRKTVLSRCLKRTNKEKEEPNSGFAKLIQQKTTEISFQYSPRAIVDLLLDSMKDYPVLWQFNNEPFNENFGKAVESLCKIINDNWSVNIDHLKMRRSINRILRFYCYLFPNENIENIHEFTCYYDKCAVFLPLSVTEIAYARCSHCYICFKNDFDLKRHLLKEQKYNLKWSYKCVQCKECFREIDEYEFHKLLSHYDEIFRCEPCNKKFTRRNIYNRHIVEYHSKPRREPGKYKCDLCDKEFETIHSLRYHKITHGERKYKCHLCPKSYFENAKLRLHLKIHRREYDFMCEVCGKEFALQAPLKIHMKKHTGEKITCSICNLKLRKSSLSRHMRLLHSANQSTDGTLTRKRPNYRRLIRPNPFRRRKECEGRSYNCKSCNIIFEKYKLLAEHNKEFHSDVPKWSCQMCTTEFRHKVNLKRHYRRKHDLHVIQAYKLVEENEDLNDVLAIKSEHLNKLAGSPSKQTEIIKSEYLSDEISFEEEKVQTFTIQDEIMTVADIAKEDIKIDYMSDFFTDILK